MTLLHNLNDFLTWAGLYTDENFWSTPLGLFSTYSMFVCCAVNIFHPGIDDNLFDRVFYSAAAVIVLCAFTLGLHPEQDPKNVMQTFWLLLWVRFAGSVIVRHREWKRTGRPQKTKCG